MGPIVSASADIPKALTMLRKGIARVPGSSLENMAGLTPEMRRVKDAKEIELVQKAVDITGAGIAAAMKAVEPGTMEYQLQSVLQHVYEMEGAQFLGFPTILALGPNATALASGRPRLR